MTYPRVTIFPETRRKSTVEWSQLFDMFTTLSKSEVLMKILRMGTIKNKNIPNNLQKNRIEESQLLQKPYKMALIQLEHMLKGLEYRI